MLAICPSCGARIPKPRRKRIAQALPGPSRAEKKARKRETTRERRRRVYAEVDARSGGRCEAIAFEGRCPRSAVEHDHFWGRGKAPETRESVWHLCLLHHRAKTRNEPGRLQWVRSFRLHCIDYGYADAAHKAVGVLALEEAQHPRPSPPRDGRQDTKGE